MRSAIFEFDFGRTDVYFLSLIPATINLFIFIYVSLFIKRTRVTGYFAIFVFTLMLWQLTEGVLKLSSTAVAAEFWYSIVQKALSLVVIFGILFSLFFTKLDKKISWNILFSIVVFPAMFFAFCIDGNLIQSTQIKSEYWHWIFNPNVNFITLVFLSWISLGALFMLLVFWLNLKRKWKTVEEKNQATLLAFGFTIPIIIGIVIEIVFPILFKINDVPITSSLTTLFSILAFIAIKKYRMLEYSPKHHWEDIVDSMNEGILIVDNKDEIKYANEAFCKLLEYNFVDIEGKRATELFFAQKSIIDNNTSKSLEQSQRNSEQYEILLQTRTGKQKWFLVGLSPYIDSYGNLVGTIGIHADITARKRAEEELVASNIELEIFVYKASHDLRGPLASIIGLVNVSKYEITDELGMKYLGMIESATQKLDTTLKELVKTMKIKDTLQFSDLVDFEEIIAVKLNEFKYYN
ncbi:MAG: PAS domain S-box protein, partial [Bacteroidetes bacterium]|nr:PAS domain S-box protein [Bacteroidota bacterium]